MDTVIPVYPPLTPNRHFWTKPTHRLKDRQKDRWTNGHGDSSIPTPTTKLYAGGGGGGIRINRILDNKQKTQKKNNDTGCKHSAVTQPTRDLVHMVKISATQEKSSSASAAGFFSQWERCRSTYLMSSG